VLTSPSFIKTSSAEIFSTSKSPFEYVAAALRAVEAETDADPSVIG
jgi:hypothetical protein